MANKPPKTVADQILLLKDRGLLFRNEKESIHFFHNISYYRLKGYWWEMQNDTVNHTFYENSYFEDALDFYNFDRHLRLLIFDAIERIEVALRTKLIYNLSLSYGPIWYYDLNLFTDAITHMSYLGHLGGEISRSKEQFILEHHKNHKNECPESWKALEVASLGSLSKLYKNLKHQLPEKSKIANEFGLALHSDFSSWLEAVTVVRNVIAHHFRLWNNNISTKFTWPNNFKVAPLSYIPDNNQRAKLFSLLSAILYLNDNISPGHSIKNKLFELFEEFPSVPLHKMGFPANWKQQPVWVI